MNPKYTNLFLSIAGAALLWAAWPTSPLTLLIFIGWVPLLMVADNCTSLKKFFGYTYLHMLLWNLGVTWWVANSTIAGGLSAFLANSLVMCIPWLLYFVTKRYTKPLFALFALALYWLSFEYIHLNWDLSWPWLTLGNAFATHPNWVQWYEYTGTSGGSLWVLLLNIIAFVVLKTYRQEGRSTTYFKWMAGLVAVLCLPILASRFAGKAALTVTHNRFNVVVVQPNFDPWDDKFEAGKQDANLQTLIHLSQQQIDADTRLVVWPETAVPNQVDERKLKENFFLAPMWNFLRLNPHINLLTGIEGYKQFSYKHSRYTIQTRDGNFYESYNSAALFDSTHAQVYHKSKLVPGPEVLPAFVSFLGPVFEKFGGTTGGYARDSIHRVLKTTNGSFDITPAVCYESIYGDHLAGFNRKGANLICIITNDGWWGNTQGYKQHMHYARLRAIESRKWVARSANTGISCFIDPYGNIIQQLGWDQRGALKQTVAAFVTETFFTKHGDWISMVVLALTIGALLYTLYRYYRIHRKYGETNRGD